MGIHADFRTMLWNREQIEDEIERLLALLDADDGDPDLEPEEDCGADDLGEGLELYRTLPRYDLDQTKGPINEREAIRQHYRDMRGR